MKMNVHLAHCYLTTGQQSKKICICRFSGIEYGPKKDLFYAAKPWVSQMSIYLDFTLEMLAFLLSSLSRLLKQCLSSWDMTSMTHFLILLILKQHMSMSKWPSCSLSTADRALTRLHSISSNG